MDTWLSLVSRRMDLPPRTAHQPRLHLLPCLENERVELGCASLHWWRTTHAGDDPALGVDTRCAFPDRTALKTAVDNCLAVDATGTACCNRGATAARRDDRDG